MINTDEVESLYRDLLAALGQDPDDEALAGSPRRAARFWKDFLDFDPGSIDAAFDLEYAGDQFVVLGGVRAWSICQHLCMAIREVRDQGARTATACLRGRLAEDPQLAERMRAAGTRPGARP